MDYFEVIIDARTGKETVRPYTTEEIAAIEASLGNRVREARNDLLVACDWTQLPDAPVDQTAWAAYRQALRDITSQEGFPTNVVWPTKPE